MLPALLALAFDLSGQAQPAIAWKAFTGKSGYSLNYPGTWKYVSAAGDMLDIESGPDWAEGAIITARNAEITVFPATEAEENKIKAQLIEDMMISHAVITNPGAQKGACRSFTKVVSTENMGPGSDDRKMNLFCTIGEHRFVVMFRAWVHNKRLRFYMKIAEEMARSLRCLACETPRP